MIVFGKNQKLSPPKRLIFIGSGDFIKIGELFQQDFVAKGLISPNSSVLDVGCGIGRSAIPLIPFLKGGKYDGFDIMKSGINWCKKNISNHYSNFNFKLVDLSNDLYKNSGSNAANFTFPYPSDSFDLVIVLSVFTHMIQDEVEQYLNEINRVLKINGACYATFFILNNDSIKNMNVAGDGFNFKYDQGNYCLINKDVRSANVAFKERYLIDSLFPTCALTVKSIEYGSWSRGGSQNPIEFQDRVILVKQEFK
jgi:SAM-dependent methyltransferase